MKLKREFYTGDDVLFIARSLLGKVLVSSIDNTITSGIITEAEAYAGITDRASHAYNGRRTPRTEMMYAEGGVAYMYICYGMHNMFNVVTNIKEVPDAVLIRAIFPLEGIPNMILRRNKVSADKQLTGGPGTVAQALGLSKIHNGADLGADEVWIEDRNIYIPPEIIKVTPRIGVESAGEAANYPYRFLIGNSFFREYQS